MITPDLGTEKNRGPCIPAILADVPTLESIMPITCAWCLKERGIVPRSGSHGICTPHANILLEQQRARHTQEGGTA